MDFNEYLRKLVEEEFAIIDADKLQEQAKSDAEILCTDILYA